MIDRFITGRLSRKLLVLTISFVMLAEFLLFVPSAALYRHDWLDERAQKASLLAQALTGVPDYEASEMLTRDFMKDTDVMLMAAKRDGMTELVLGAPPENLSSLRMIDLREDISFPALIWQACKDFFGPEDGYIRVMANSRVVGQDALELILPRAALREDLRNYFQRILLLSLLIAIITGGLIYWAMASMVIRPVKSLADDMTAFRENPQKRRSLTKRRYRDDEIGQLEREFYDVKQSLRATFRQRERLAGLGLSVAKINHDLRNVLSSALLISERLERNAEPGLSDMGRKLGRVVDRGIGLTEDVLAYSRADTADPEFQDVRLSFLIGEAAADVLDQFPNVDFSNSVPTELLARTDPDHAYRIFHNLFRNAAQAMQDKEPRRLTVSAKQDGEFVHVLIADTGSGLPEKVRKTLFQAFTAGRGQGSTGLGLSISKELAIAQGGDLSLDQSGAGGTTFRLSLPSITA